VGFFIPEAKETVEMMYEFKSRSLLTRQVRKTFYMQAAPMRQPSGIRLRGTTAIRKRSEKAKSLKVKS
jgi:hypothetical protein